MDNRLKIKTALRTVLCACLAILLLSAITATTLQSLAAPSGDAAGSPFPPDRRLYDYAELYSAAEVQTLNAALSAASADVGAHFIILTTNENVDLEGYVYDFYNANIRGLGGVIDCVTFSVNMETRESYIDCLGELRSMISDDEIVPVWESLRPYLSEGDYNTAADTYISGMSALIKHKYGLYNIETPEVDPAQRLYDFGGLLTPDEYDVLSEWITDISDKTGVDYIIAILNEYADQEYLKRFASSFYSDNFKGKAKYTGAYMLTISCDDKLGGSQTKIYKSFAVSPFGTYDPENSILWNDQWQIDYKQDGYTVFDICGDFLSRKLDDWHSANIVLPDFDPNNYVTDYSNALTGAQRDTIIALFEEKSKELNTRFYFVIAPYWTPGATYQFAREFREKYRDWFPVSHVLLIVSGPPEIRDEVAVTSLYCGGRRPINKIGTVARSGIDNDVRWAVNERGDYQEAAEAFVRISSKALKSFFPKATMEENLNSLLLTGLIAAFLIPAITILIMRILHNFGLKRKVSARSYFVRGSLLLHYKSDRFVSTATTRISIESNSGSGSHGGGFGGGGGGSSGGGHSSRAGGSF